MKKNKKMFRIFNVKWKFKVQLLIIQYLIMGRLTDSSVQNTGEVDDMNLKARPITRCIV